MRFEVKRLFGVSALSLFLCLGLAGCSGQQQAEEGVEVSEAGDGQEAENQAAENNAEGGENQATNQSEDGGGSQEATSQSETADAGGNGSENDLQEIINEMNGQPAAEPPADAATAEATAAPMDASASAEVPAVPESPQPEAQAAAPAPSSPVPAATPAAPEKAPEATAGSTSNVMPFQPGGSPAGNGLPEIGSKMAYIVEQGDTLGKISKKIYGVPSRWKELASLSGLTNPSRIFPGDVVYYTLDEKAVAFAQAYESTSRMEVQVGQGETLATIAKKVYGTGKAWRAIWRQNDKIDNPDIVPPGTVIYYLPAGAATAAAKNLHLDSRNTASIKAKTKTQKNIAQKNIHNKTLKNIISAFESSKTISNSNIALITKNSDVNTAIYFA